MPPLMYSRRMPNSIGDCREPMRHLTVDEILELHRLVFLQSGGAIGIRDLGALDSAVAQTRVAFQGTDLYPRGKPWHSITNRRTGAGARFSAWRSGTPWAPPSSSSPPARFRKSRDFARR